MNIDQLQTIETFNNSAIQYESSIAQLSNYNETYNYLIEKINQNQNVLELACGTANISKYLLQKKKLNITGYDLSDEMLKIAKRNIPNGKFINQSIIDFKTDEKVDVVINGFGLPYLNDEQVLNCFKKTYEVLNVNGLFYLSFMNGNKSELERPSFSPNNKILVHYHQKDEIIGKLRQIRFEILKEWEIDYVESDGSITKDIILIGRKSPVI